jgi:hypothetical protein
MIKEKKAERRQPTRKYTSGLISTADHISARLGYRPEGER